LGVTWPVPRFSDNGNGTVRDNLTGLLWLEDADCLGQMTWVDALSGANSLSAPSCGLLDGSSSGDWRLPNIKELQSLLDFGQAGSVLPSDHPFTDLALDYYWSSNSRADDHGPGDAQALSFGSGMNFDFAKGETKWTWALRGPDTLGSAPVETTGQTICYDETGVIIDCLGTGQDGESQAGVEWPVPRFIDGLDGTVLDRLTGILWLKDANCLGLVDWSTAIAAANTLEDGLCGLTDGSRPKYWHLANVRELQSLSNFGLGGPSLPAGHPFENVANDDYWTGTSNETQPDRAWRVNFNSGGVQRVTKTDAAYLWPARPSGMIFTDGFESGDTLIWSPNPVTCRVASDVRYEDCGDGTVRDTVTGLLWLRDASCADLAGTDAEGRAVFDPAMAAAAQLAHGTCGLADGSEPGDWRVASRDEWDASTAAAVALSCVHDNSPTLTNDIGDACLQEGPSSFVGVWPERYWTSTDFGPNAFIEILWHGQTDLGSKTYNNYIWPVRWP